MRNNYYNNSALIIQPHYNNKINNINTIEDRSTQKRSSNKSLRRAKAKPIEHHWPNNAPNPALAHPLWPTINNNPTEL